MKKTTNLSHNKYLCSLLKMNKRKIIQISRKTFFSDEKIQNFTPAYYQISDKIVCKKYKINNNVSSHDHLEQQNLK
jgi:hypothetical protein